MKIAIDEHIIICSSHLKFDHNIQYKAEQMAETRMKKRDATSAINQQTLAQSE